MSRHDPVSSSSVSAGRLHALLAALQIGNRRENQPAERQHRSLGVLRIGDRMRGEPRLHGGRAVDVGRRRVDVGDRSFERIVLRRKGHPPRLVQIAARKRCQPFQHQVVDDREGIGGLEPVDERDRVAEHVANPLDVMGGRQAQVHPFDARVVTLSRPQHEPVPTE